VVGLEEGDEEDDDDDGRDAFLCRLVYCSSRDVGIGPAMPSPASRLEVELATSLAVEAVAADVVVADGLDTDLCTACL